MDKDRAKVMALTYLTEGFTETEACRLLLRNGSTDGPWVVSWAVEELARRRGEPSIFDSVEDPHG